MDHKKGFNVKYVTDINAVCYVSQFRQPSVSTLYCIYLSLNATELRLQSLAQKTKLYNYLNLY